MCALFYRLEEKLSQSEETLAIAVLEGATLQTAYSVLTVLKGDAADQALLEKLRRQPRQQQAPFCYIVSRAETLPLLKLLAATGRFCHAQGQTLICDFFNAATLQYVISGEADALQFCTKVQVAKREFLLSEAAIVLPGPPMWLRMGPFLYLLKADCSWKRVKQLASVASIAIDTEWREWLAEEERRDCLSGKVELLLKQQAKAAEPLPLLVLRDRVGAFADLKMDYSNGWVVDFSTQSQSVEKRNVAAEKNWEKDLLETDYTIKPVGTSRYYCAVDRVGKSLAFLLELGWNIQDVRGNKLLKHDAISFEGELKADRILVKGGVCYGDFQADLTQLAGAFNRREHFVQLGSGVVGLLPDHLDKQTICQLAEEGELIAGGRGFSRSVLPKLEELSEVGEFKASDALKQFMDSILEPKQVSSTIPGFTGTLRPYQQEGVGWLRALYENGLSGLLADEMGLGKTVQVLAFLASLETSERPSMIVMPTSLLFNWRYELERFVPENAFVMHHGPLRAKSVAELCDCSLILTSYTTLRLDQELFRLLPLHCLILDEAQAIKNPESQIAQAVLRLSSQFRLSLTGTPIENRLEELWSQFRFLMPSLLGTYEKFQLRLQAMASGNREMLRLKKSVSPFIMRRKKEEVAKDLPAKTEQEVWVEMPSSQRQFYEEFLAGVKGKLFKKVSEDGVEKHRMEILEAILRLRQICCHPLLAMPGMPEVESGKLFALLDEVEVLVEEGRKILIFSQFAAMLHLIKREFQYRNWNTLLLDGETKDRERLVGAFQNDPTVPLFLISLKAGGVGLNLTAADTVILFDPWWNVAAENQAIDRAHRIGQTKPLLVKRYLMVESIEEKVNKLKESKRLLADELFEDVPKVSVEELLALL